jgi:hypothetical protein
VWLSQSDGLAETGLSAAAASDIAALLRGVVLDDDDRALLGVRLVPSLMSPPR